MKRPAGVYLVPAVAALSSAECNGGKLAPGVRLCRSGELEEEGAGKLHSLGKAVAIHVQTRSWKGATVGKGEKLIHAPPGGLNRYFSMVDEFHIYWICFSFAFLFLWHNRKGFLNSSVNPLRSWLKRPLFRVPTFNLLEIDFPLDRELYSCMYFPHQIFLRCPLLVEGGWGFKVAAFEGVQGEGGTVC